jgi:hypothetical protein
MCSMMLLPHGWLGHNLVAMAVRAQEAAAIKEPVAHPVCVKDKRMLDGAIRAIRRSSAPSSCKAGICHHGQASTACCSPPP